VLQRCGDWDVARDAKLTALSSLLAALPPQQKVLIFSQFADTVDYLVEHLQRRGFQRLAGVTGEADDPTLLAWRFSPRSNGKRASVTPEQELRILVATDGLSERAEPARLCLRRQLRPALGDHPPDPSGPAASTASASRPSRSSAPPSCRPTAWNA